jgi:hypothetical protein
MTDISSRSPYRPSNAHKATSYPEYGVWKGMRSRCNNPNVKDYKWYGAKGITVCEEWDDFWCFLHDMKYRPSADHTIERKNSKGPYCKENCEWLPKNKQNLNQSSNRYLTLNNETHFVTEWARILNVKPIALFGRLNRGWSDVETLTTPIQKQIKP